MSFRNPTPIQIGMAGTFEGRRYRVAGRVVMGMEDGGETYYWNEFNLVNDSGQSVTLVYEETERGGEWRLFTMFDPECPITAADAATKRVGDRLNLDGNDMRVTLVDESRVYLIEGEAPEGVEVGDVAHYFNIEAGSQMQVVSWTGDEVECYRGVNLSRGLVAGAFNLRTDQFKLAIPASSFSSSSGGSSLSQDAGGGVVKIVVFGIIAIFFLSQFSSCRLYRRRAVPAKVVASEVSLSLGGEGKLGGKTYRLREHVLMEIGQDGVMFDRHEYQVVDEEGNSALLLCGLSPGKADWYLFMPVHPLEPMPPLQAGALRVGEVVNVDGYIAPVTELVQSTVRQVNSGELPEAKIGTITYGVVARSDLNILLVRWNQSGIVFYRSVISPLKDDEIKAFGAKTSR